MIATVTANLPNTAENLKNTRTGQPTPAATTAPPAAHPNGPATRSDTVQFSYSAETTVTYSSSLSLKGQVGDGFDLLRGLVLNIFKEHGLDYQIAAGDQTIDLSRITQEEAQELVADDGYFGVEQTAERIFSLAVGIAGGDPTKIDEIRAGVEHGFQEALDAFGGWLPDISYSTLDAVMSKLDEWAGKTDSPAQVEVKP
jgi:hypothetical protein